MKRIPSKVVAVEGHSVLVDVGAHRIQITQFESTNLKAFCTSEEIQKSISIRAAIQNGWLVPYKGQKLPKKPASKIDIPKMKIGQGPASIKFKVTKHKRQGREARVEYEADVPEATKKMIKEAQIERKQQLLKEKKELLDKQSEELETDVVIKKGTADIPEITVVRVDGKDIPLKDFAAPKRGPRKTKKDSVKVDVYKKTATKESKK